MDDLWASDRACGSSRIFDDLQEAGERIGGKLVARIMRENGIRAVHNYRKPRYVGGCPVVDYPNRLQREFTVDRAARAWVTGITYVRTWQRWLYLAVVVDLCSRRVVGWSMKPSLRSEIVLDALLMAV